MMASIGLPFIFQFYNKASDGIIFSNAHVELYSNELY